MKAETVNENIRIFQNAGSLAFSTDAYLLYAYIRRQSKENAAELGAGSGVISLLAMSKEKFKHITAFEIQENIANLAVLNVEKNGFSGKIDVICQDVKTIPPSYHHSMGAVFANPPYMRCDTGKLNDDTADSISRHEVHGGIADFAAAGAKLLKHGGLFYAVYRPDRLSELLYSLKSNHLEPKRMTLVYPTVDSVPCLVLVEAKKYGADGIFVTKPLIIYKSGMEKTNENYTDDMKYIYENGAFHELYQRL